MKRLWRILRKKQNFICPNKTNGICLKKINGSMIPILFIAPSLIGVSIFVLIPFADVLKKSFFTSNGETFVWFHNYFTVLHNDAFRLAASNTVKFAAICIPLLVVISLLLALFLNTINKYRDMGKSVFLLPLAIPAASMVLIWKLFFHENGLINGWIEGLGGGSIPFMTSNAAFWVLIGSYLWKNMGYDMILWIGGLSSISLDLYEAASIDGADKVQQFFFITLPNLIGVLFMIFVLSLLNSFKVFREAYLVAGEYPHTSMYMLQHLFNNWFTALDIEKLSAGAVLMALVIFTLILILKRLWGEGD